MSDVATLDPIVAEPEAPQVERRRMRCTRVLHVINGEHFAGAERVQDLLAARLPEFGYEAAFVTLKQGSFAVHRRTTAAPCVSATMSSSWDLSAAWRTASLVRDSECALIHSHTPRSLVIGAIASLLTGRPLVHHLHSPTLQDTEKAWKNRLNATVEKWAIRRASELISVSYSLQEEAREKGFPLRATVIHNGVPEAGPLPSRPRPTSEWTIGVAAPFRPRKGIEVLIDALAELRKEGRPVRLLGVGRFESPDYAEAIRRRTGELRLGDCVEWAGFQKDVTAAMRRMDALVLPSLYGEGLPMVVLEAMAAGTPVVASDLEGISEAIVDEKQGLLFPPGDASALANQIRRLMDAEVDWAALREAAHERQAAKFSDRVMASQVAETYRQVLNG